VGTQQICRIVGNPNPTSPTTTKNEKSTITCDQVVLVLPMFQLCFRLPSLHPKKNLQETQKFVSFELPDAEGRMLTKVHWMAFAALKKLKVGGNGAFALLYSRNFKQAFWITNLPSFHQR